MISNKKKQTKHFKNMASRKLTALPTATEVTTSDKIYIVDVSDTTESPQGTSKQALISELPSSGITSITSTDGSIDIDNTDPSAPDLSIGYKEIAIAFTSTSGSDAGTATILNPSDWYGTLTISRTDNQIAISSDETPFTAGKVLFECNFVGDDSAQGFFYVPEYGNTSLCTISVLDGAQSPFNGALGNGLGLFCSIKIKVYS